MMLKWVLFAHTRSVFSSRKNEQLKVCLLDGYPKETYQASHIPKGSNLTLEFLDETITRLELRLEDLEKEVEETNNIFPNPWK